MFNDHFLNAGGKVQEPRNSRAERDVYLKRMNNILFKFSLVTNNDVRLIFKDITPKNSTGIDDLSTRVLKSIQEPLIPILCIIINQSLINGVFPSKLKLAKVKPLYKKDDASQFENYRPISLLPVISKVFEKVVHKQVYDYFVSNNLFFRNQYGYRKYHSTEHAALELVDRIYESLDKGEIPITIFLDLSKAFDTINHSILLEKTSKVWLSFRRAQLVHQLFIRKNAMRRL